MNSPTPQHAGEILLLSEPDGADAGLIQLLEKRGVVRPIADIPDALAALRGGGFDLVVAPSSKLAALARAAGRLRAETILEKLGQGVCLATPEGALNWCNAKLRSYPHEAVEAIRQKCADQGARWRDPAVRPDPQMGVTEQFRAAELELQLTVWPLLDESGRLEQLLALVWDTTASRRLQERIGAIEAAGAELVRLETEELTKLDVPERLQLLEDKLIRYSRELLSFDHFACRLLDRATGRLETVLSSGLTEEAKSLEIFARAEGNGITGYVAATGRSYVCADVSKDPMYLPGLEGARSSLTVPLSLHDEIVGVLNVESDTPNKFSEEDRVFAEIFAHYIAIALHVLQLLVVERHTATGQITADVRAELSAPLNDLVTELSSAIADSQLSVVELRARLESVLHHAERAQQAVAEVTSGSGVKGLAPDAARKDPLLDGKRILIADDEDVIRETVADVLAKAGALVSTARDGLEAEGLIRNTRFDLVLSDIKMPHKNGYEVFAAVRRVNAVCPVVLITGFGYDPNHSIVRASKEGLAGVLFKPFKVEQLLEEVRHALNPPPRK